VKGQASSNGVKQSLYNMHSGILHHTGSGTSLLRRDDNPLHLHS
jgi:hypothetical protein